MRPRVDLITLAVPDLVVARRFYVDGLGWKPTFEAPGQVVFIQIGYGLLLALFSAEHLAADLGTAVSAPRNCVNLAHNVDDADQVVEVFNSAIAAGASVVKAPQSAAFGGFHAYFADPSGFLWEVAHNPGWSVDTGGRVLMTAEQD